MKNAIHKRIQGGNICKGIMILYRDYGNIMYLPKELEVCQCTYKRICQYHQLLSVYVVCCMM